MIKLNSWHVWLANYPNKLVYEGDKFNFCDYFWMVVSGFMKLAGSCLAVFLVLVLTLRSYYEFYMWMFHDIKMDEGAIVVVVFSMIIAFAVFTAWAILKYVEYREELEYNEPPKVEKEPGFFTLAYRKFKQKTCFIVQVERKK